jgi:hypothetical protein
MWTDTQSKDGGKRRPIERKNDPRIFLRLVFLESLIIVMSPFISFEILETVGASQVSMTAVKN